MSVPKRPSVALKLPQLQNLIKRDPIAYKEEFEQQRRHFESELEIFKLRPTADSDRFTELVTFMSHVVSSYKNDCTDIPQSLLQLLEGNGSILHPDVRAKLLSACIHLRNKNLIEPLVLLQLAFKLFAIPDKTLRQSLSEYIFNDIKGINLNKHNEKLNKRVQASLYALVTEDTGIIAKSSVGILTELYRRRVWTDARTVNVLAKACTSSNIQIAVRAVNFFLGIQAKMQDDEEEEKQELQNKVNPTDHKARQHTKKTKKRITQQEKSKERAAKLKREAEMKAASATPVFPAIALIHDPQTLSEKLFQRARGNGERFEVKLLLMNFISRLIGCHKLVLLPFYSFLQRYLNSHQSQVTRILAYLVQGCHDLVPPEDLVPVIKTIAYNFITERCSNEAMAVGLNAVREVLTRVPTILKEEGMDDFVQDLAMYGRKQHKSVMIAAHAVVNFVRATYPKLLKTKDRGKFHNPDAVPSDYGAEKTASRVEGADLLEAMERGEIFVNSDDEIVWKEDIENESDTEDDSEEEQDESSTDESDGEEAPVLVEVDDEGNVVASGSEEESDNDEESWETVSGSEEEGNGEDETAGEEDGWVTASDDSAADSEEEEEGSDAGVDSESEWEMMSDDEDEEAKKAKKGKAVGDNEVGEKRRRDERNISQRVDARRVLSEEDFDLIRRLKEAQAQRLKDPKYRSKKARLLRESKTGASDANIPTELAESDSDGDDSDNNVPELPSYYVNPEDLGAGMRTGKASKLERLETILAGRKDSKWEQGGHGGGLTNKEKERRKNFLMIRKGKKSVRGKVTKSNSAQRYEKMTAKEQYGRDKRKRRRT